MLGRSAALAARVAGSTPLARVAAPVGVAASSTVGTCMNAVRCMSTLPLPPPSLALNTLHGNPGARKAKRRKGRGPGSGKGKTAGRGHKGQRARNSVRLGFEGGQTPLYKRLPKRGFSNARYKREMEPLNLDRLQLWIDMGRLDASRTITLKDLRDSGCVGRFKYGVKLLADGAELLQTPVDIEVTQVSEAAIAAIEAVGGSVKSVYFGRVALRAHLQPEKFAVMPANPQPPPRLQPYYTSYAKRGYLSSEVQLKEVLATRGVEGSGSSNSSNNDEL